MRTLNRNGSVFYPLERGIDLQPIMRQVYAWMGLGMLLSAVVAAVTVGTSLIDVAANPVIFLVAIVAEFGMVLGLSAGLGRMSAGTATMLFFAYAALNGFTLSVVLLAFTSATVISAFVATAALFGVMSVIGYTTQVDLTRMGTYLMMGVIGLVIAMIVSMFISSGPLDMLISMAGVLIFTALTAYDTQRISRMATQISIEDGQASAKLGVIGALTLYLDFVNMFLFMLRLMGGRRR
jgi:FtsH-binding integral membrane protein